MNPVKEERSEFISFDQTKLFYQSWTPQRHKAAVVIVHGLGEHSGRYETLAVHLADQGYQVYALDLRGNGRSPGTRGHIRSFEIFCRDVESFVVWLSHHGAESIFLLGHSMGGLVVLNSVQRESLDFLRGVVVSSPFFEPAKPVSKKLLFLSRILNRLMPRFAVKRSPDELDYLSHDPKVAEAYQRDAHCHMQISCRLYWEVQKTGERLLSSQVTMRPPILMLLAGDDHIVKREKAEHFFDVIRDPQKQKVIYDDYYHEIFNEIGKAQVFEDLVRWLKQQP